MPMVMTVLMLTFPPERRGSALGLFGALIARVIIAVASGASNHRYLACGLGPMAMAAALFISGVWNTSGLLVALAAFCVGWSFACQSLF